MVMKLMRNVKRILIHYIPPLFYLIYYIVPLPIIVIMLLFRPVILIRVGSTSSQRIGHFILNTYYYLCERDAGLHPEKIFDVFFLGAQVSNYHVQKMIEKQVRIWNLTRFAYIALNYWKRLFPLLEQHMIETSARDRFGIFENSNRRYSFTQKEEEEGESFLRNMNIKNNNYVCAIARDSEYLKRWIPQFDFAYHDYRDVDIDTYVPALEYLVSRGHYVFRMGSAVRKGLTVSNPMIIDYAVNGMRTDFLDIFLSANCKFIISSGTGLDSVSKVFRRPILYVNFVPLEYIHGECSYDLTILRKIWIKDKKRFMTFREILDSGVGKFLHLEDYQKNNLEIIDNTSDEIQIATVEMNNRLNMTWITSEDDEELQRIFWSLFKPSEANRVFHSRIGADFLRQNQELLL